jgi:hypothetical protein
MLRSFTYNDAPLLEVRDSHVPFKTGLQDYEGEKLECKIYRYQVAPDIAVDVILPTKYPTTAYTRGLLLNKDGKVVAFNKTGLAHLNRTWLKDYLRKFNRTSRRKSIAWIEDYRAKLVTELNDAGYHLDDN